MTKYNNSEVSAAVLAQHVFVQDVGQVGPTLSNVKTPTTKSVKMKLEDGFLVLTLTNKFGKEVIELVPLSAVYHFTPIIKVKDAKDVK